MGTTTEKFNVHEYLKGTAIALPSAKVGIVIPSTINHTVPAWNALGVLPEKYALQAPKEYTDAIHNAVYSLLSQFGGFTQSEQFGGWVDTDNHKAILERGTFVWAYGDITKPQMEMLLTIAQATKGLLKQDNILIVVDDKPYLV